MRDASRARNPKRCLARDPDLFHTIGRRAATPAVPSMAMSGSGPSDSDGSGPSGAGSDRRRTTRLRRHDGGPPSAMPTRSNATAASDGSGRRLPGRCATGCNRTHVSRRRVGDRHRWDQVRCRPGHRTRRTHRSCSGRSRARRPCRKRTTPRSPGWSMNSSSASHATNMVQRSVRSVWAPLAPSPRDSRRFSPVNIPAWRNFPLRRRLQDTTQLAVFGDLDAKALALAEGWLGAAQGHPNFCALTVSTGVGRRRRPRWRTADRVHRQRRPHRPHHRRAGRTPLRMRRARLPRSRGFRSRDRGDHGPPTDRTDVRDHAAHRSPRRARGSIGVQRARSVARRGGWQRCARLRCDVLPFGPGHPRRARKTPVQPGCTYQPTSSTRRVGSVDRRRSGRLARPATLPPWGILTAQSGDGCPPLPADLHGFGMMVP